MGQPGGSHNLAAPAWLVGWAARLVSKGGRPNLGMLGFHYPGYPMGPHGVSWVVEAQHSKVGAAALANQAGRPTDQPGGCRKVVAAARLAHGPWPMARPKNTLYFQYFGMNEHPIAAMKL